MKLIVTAIAIFFMHAIALTQNTDFILNHYLKVKDALVKSDLKSAAEHADSLHQSINTSDSFPGKEHLLKEVQKMNDSKNIDTFRESFADVSAVLWKEIKNDPAIKDIIYYQYCPMKKMYWISREKAIKNPYYGSKMLTCGNVS